jgi:hypothetical protein
MRDLASCAIEFSRRLDEPITSDAKNATRKPTVSKLSLMPRISIIGFG